jgi:hypothetical protein
MNQIGTKSPCSKLQKSDYPFWKPDDPVLLGPTAVRGATGLWQGAPPLAKWRLDGKEVRITTTLEVGAAAKRSNPRKTKRKEKLGQNY